MAFYKGDGLSMKFRIVQNVRSIEQDALVPFFARIICGIWTICAIVPPLLFDFYSAHDKPFRQSSIARVHASDTQTGDHHPKP